MRAVVLTALLACALSALPSRATAGEMPQDVSIVQLLATPEKFDGKLVWSVLLLVPLLGWIFYGAFFQPPSVSENRAPTEHSRDAYAGMGDYPPHI